MQDPSSHISTNSLFPEILRLDSESFQEFINKLLPTLANYDAKEVSIFSPQLNKPHTLELICSTNSNPHTRRIHKSEPTHLHLFEISLSRSCEITLAIDAPNNSFRIDGLFTLAVQTKLREVVNEKWNKLRYLVISQSIRSKDVNSFLHKVLQSVHSNFFYARELTIFLHEEAFNRLVLAGTTSHLRELPHSTSSRNERILKRNIFYSDNDPGNTATVFRENRHIVEDKSTGFSMEEFDADLFPNELTSRGYWPISLYNSGTPDPNAKSVPPLGVFKISNIRRRNVDRQWSSNITFYDSYFFGFFCEAIFVLVQQYAQFIDSRTDYARLTHGIGANIDAALKLALIVRDMLFEEGEDEKQPAKFILGAGNPEHLDQLFHRSTDLIYFVEDLQFQVAKASGEKSKIEVERIDNLHSDVFMPALRLVPSIAAANSRPVPHVANLRDRGSRTLGSAWGSKEGLISILRNLFENSVKYSKGRCSIDMHFSETVDHVVIDYFDNGIGIKSKERERIFVEGFRSKEARRLSNRGIGVGLNYSREVVSLMGGELDCLERVSGAHFRLKLRKAK